MSYWRMLGVPSHRQAKSEGRFLLIWLRACPKSRTANLWEDLLDPGETSMAKVEIYPYICEQHDSDSVVSEHAAYLSGPYGLHEGLERWNCELLALDNENTECVCVVKDLDTNAVMTCNSIWEPNIYLGIQSLP